LPRAACYDPVNARVYVVDKSGRIQYFSRQGTYQGGWRMPEIEQGKPTAMDADEQGRLWVADTHYFRVIVFDPSGREVLRFGEEGDAPGQFGFVNGIAVGSSVVVTSDYRTDIQARVQVWSRDGTFIRSFGEFGRGPGQFRRPGGVSLAPNGDVLVASTNTHRVERFSQQGAYLGAVGEQGSGRGQLFYPKDVDCLPDGRFLVTEYGNNRVQLFGPDGRSLRLWGHPGQEAPGELACPWASDVDPDGRVYVVDYLNQRIQVVANLLVPSQGTDPGWH